MTLVQERHRDRTVAEKETLFKAEDVTVQFGGLTALDSVSFGIRPDEILGIIGPNGAGKSTLINVMSGIYRASRGQVSFDGRAIARIKPHQAVGLGIVRTFQTSRLFNELSVLDNVLAGMHTQTRGGVLSAVFRRRRTMQELRKAADQATRLLQELGGELMEQRLSPAAGLTHADKRRLEIARALAARPRLLLLDEPSAGMDTTETERLVADIKRLRSQRPGLAVGIIEHDMGLMRTLPDRVMVLNFGERIAIGDFSEVSKNETVRAAYLGRSYQHAAS